MRAIIYVNFLALLATSCLNNGQPIGTGTGAPILDSSAPPPNTELQGKAFAISTDAFYQSIIQTPSTQGQIVSLSLTPEHTAELTVNNIDNSRGRIDTGVWTTLNNGNLLVNLKGKTATDSLKLEFKTEGQKLVYSGTEFGTTGLTLWVKPVPDAN